MRPWLASAAPMAAAAATTPTLPLHACPRGWYPGPFGRCRANGT